MTAGNRAATAMYAQIKYRPVSTEIAAVDPAYTSVVTIREVVQNEK
jgi:hypothetical protein